MDPLSDVLALLRPSSYMFRAVDASGAWSIHLPEYDAVKCYSLVRGRCWIALDGADEPVLFQAGECVILPRGRAFRLCSDLALPAIDILKTFENTGPGGLVRLNGGGETAGIGGYFDFEGPHAKTLMALLPPIVHIRNAADRATVHSAVERIMHELRDPQPGGYLLAQQLAQMLFMHALRTHLSSGQQNNLGWIFALADPQLGSVLTAMHAHPAQRWTLAELAGRAHMSRSTFAAKFKSTVGISPLEYLTRWRMRVAEERLLTSSDPLSIIATELGYESESAFSTAFKRVVGVSPRRHGRGHGMKSAAASP